MLTALPWQDHVHVPAYMTYFVFVAAAKADEQRFHLEVKQFQLCSLEFWAVTAVIQRRELEEDVTRLAQWTRSRHGTRHSKDNQKRYANVGHMFRAIPQGHHTAALGLCHGLR